ncbi:Upf2 [Symbiodinium natans]|uniref:Upf2 protein n=1 Tax=Symbiodinium natans TaxID=878477 RepID=A0A812PXV0_9DINO|nr:Upf2 [Symbiodinium natans]
MVDGAKGELFSALQLLNSSLGKPASVGCGANCQVCAQLVLENNSPQQTGAGLLWSQKPSLYFDFDELDDIEEVGRPVIATALTPVQPKQRLYQGVVTLQIVAAITGAEVCKLTHVALDWTIWDVKELIERMEGTKLSSQKLLCDHGKVASDNAILGDVLDGASGANGRNPQLSLIRSPPVWAGLLASIAAGEVHLEDLDEGARSDRAIVLAAVNASQGRALAHASATLRGDKEIVAEAVKRNGLSLRHATPAMRADRDLVLTAVRECPMALEFASDMLRKDHDFIVNAVRVSARAAGCVAEELQRNLSFAGELLSAFPAVFAHLPPQLRTSSDFILRAVRCNGDVLRFATGWHSHPEVVLTAIQKAPQAVHFVDASLRQRAEFGTAAVMVNPWVFEQLGSQHRNDLALALQAARAQPALAHFAGDNIKGKVLSLIQKEQSEAFGAPEGYVDGPVWWLPETLKQRIERRELISQLKRRGSKVEKAALAEKLLYHNGTLTDSVQDIMLGIGGFKDAGAWYSAIHVLAMMQRGHMAVDLPLVNCVMSACKDRGHELAQQLVAFLVAARIQPDANTFRCAALCCSDDQWSFALQWLAEAKKEAVPHVPLGGVYTAVMSVARKARCWDVALPLLKDMQQWQEAPDTKFFNSALWSCSRGQWEVSVHLLRRMESAGVPSEPFTYFAASQEVPDESTASCMVQHLRRMRTHSLHIDICQYAKMLAHYARDDEWPSLRRAVLEGGGFLLPLRRCLTHNFDQEIGWYRSHVLESKNLTRQWLDSFPDGAQYADWRRLRKTLKKLRRPDPLDYSDIGAHAGYIRNKVFEKDRCTQVACVLFGPEAVAHGLEKKESCVVVDVGGGPGIAALGIAVYAELEGWPVHLKHHVVDCEAAWSGTLQRLQSVLRHWRPESALQTELRFHQGQLMSKTLAQGVPAPADTDIFIFSYVLHENIDELRSSDFGLLSTLLQAMGTQFGRLVQAAVLPGLGMGKAGSAKAITALVSCVCYPAQHRTIQASGQKDGKAAKVESKTDSKEPSKAPEKAADDPKAKLAEEARQKFADDERDELARIDLRKLNRAAKASGSQMTGNRDKSIARVTRFQNRLKLFKGESEIDAVMKDIDGVDASKYVSELTECILEAAGTSLKLKELSAVNKICSKLNATYEEFGALLGKGLVKAFASTPTSELNRRRFLLRMCAELSLIECVQAPKPLVEIFAELCDISVPEEQLVTNFTIISSLAQKHAVSCFNIVPAKQQAYAEALGKDWPERQCVLEEASRSKLQQLVVNAYQSAAGGLLRSAHGRLLEQEKINQALRVDKGQVDAENEQKHTQLKEALQKIESTLTTLSEFLNQPMPTTVEEEEPNVSRIGAGENSKEDVPEEEEVLIFEDSEQRKFYEDVVDLKDIIPAVLLTSGKAAQDAGGDDKDAA